MNISNELKNKYQTLISKGYTTKQVSIECNVSKSTVQRHLHDLGIVSTHKIVQMPLTKEELQPLVDQHLSTYQIASKLNKSQGYVKHWLRKFGLKTNAKWTIARKAIKQDIIDGYKTCSKCNQRKSLTGDNFYLRKNGSFHYWCRDCNDAATRQKQIDKKIKCVNYKGGKCVMCGYNAYVGALDFHHLDSTKKEFNISSCRTYRWELIKAELDKCICVCRNCHAEIHGNFRDGSMYRS